MEENVGTIVIDTRVNNSGADKDLQKLYEKVERNQQKITNLLNKREGLDINISKFEKKIDKAKEKTNELASELDRIAQEQLQIDNIPFSEENLQKAKDYLSSLTMTDDMKATQYQDYLLRAEPFQKMTQEFDKYVNEIEEGERHVDLLAQKYQNVEMQIQKCERNQVDLNEQIAEVSGKNGIDLSGMEKGFSKLVGKASKLALALVGVRTIINVITRSFNTLTQYNEELGTKVEQMRLVLAVALEPVINWIISALQVVLSLINQIYMAFTGIDLYGRASELWSAKMAKNMSSSAGSARDMRKQLAGFDEMNVLQDNVAGAGGGGGKDFTDWALPQEEIPEWLNWILRNGEPLGAIMGGVAGGALLMLDGLTRLYFGLQEYDKNPTLENFGEIVHRAGESITGFGMLTMDMPTVIGGAFMAIAGILTKHKKEVDKWVDDVVKNIDRKAKWLDKNVSSTAGAMLGNLGVSIQFVKDDFFELMKEAQFDFDSIRKIIQKFIVGDIKGAWNEVEIWISKKWETEKQRFFKAVDVIKTKIQNLIGGVTQDFDKAKTNIINIFNYIVNTIIGLVNGTIKTIENAFAVAVNWISNRLNELTGIFRYIGISIGDSFSGAIKGAVNGALSWIEGKVNTFISMINNVVSVINKIQGVRISRLSYISLPRLATGGIINQPGKGVMVGGAIAGESGREGILPLTDRQAMAELGKEIGKWISIQATIPVNIGNRQISRVIQDINADREFAMNS